MRKFLLFFAKVAIFAVFAWNTGILQVCWKSHNSQPPAIKRSYQEYLAFEKSILDFWAKKHLAAQAKDRSCVKYSPSDYFSDLTEFYSTFGNISAGINTKISLCMELMHKEVGRKFSEQDFTRAQDKFFLATGQKAMASGNRHKTDWLSILSVIGGWLWGFYAKNFIFALCLFILWDERRCGKFSLRNPGSLFLNAILHPFTISLVVYQAMSTKIMEAETRRTKEKILTMLSDDEIAFLQKAIFDKMTRKQFRAFLEQRGLVARRSFALALIGTFLVSVIPLRMMTCEKTSIVAEKEVTRLCVSSTGHVVSHNFDSSDDTMIAFVVFLAERIFVIPFFITVLFFRSFFVLFYEQRIFRNIDHVPLLNS